MTRVPSASRESRSLYGFPGHGHDRTVRIELLDQLFHRLELRGARQLAQDELSAFAKILIDVLVAQARHHVASSLAQRGGRAVVLSVENDMGSELPFAHQVSARPTDLGGDKALVLMRRTPSPNVLGAMRAA